ncbi:MAG: hypothetical protein AAAB16_18735 [Pseudomonas sp.]|uniref:hypothetical protein n=1 Tax=Pseudomonas sp. TaxID=306 RepID=UPI0030F0B22D
MRIFALVIAFFSVCLLSSAITAMVLRPTPPTPPTVPDAPPGFVAKPTAGGGILYQRQAIAQLPNQPAPRAFPKALNLSESAKCVLTLGQDRSSQGAKWVKPMDDYCDNVMMENRKR